jgi:hypothetical protein
MIRVFILILFALDQPTAVLVEQVAASGQIVEIATPAAERVASPPQIAPGAPPLLGFRVIEGKLRHRFGDLDLVMDDAGH